MTFRVNHQPSANQARCPYRVIVRETGREIDWINQYLDYEAFRRLDDITLKSYAHELLEQTGENTHARVTLDAFEEPSPARCW